MKRLLLISVAALSLTGCAEIAKAVPAQLNSAAVSSTLDDRALAAAEDFYNEVIHAYNAANHAGLVSAPLKARAKPILAQAHLLRLAAEKAFDAANATDLNAQIKALDGLLTQIKALTPVPSK